MAKQHPLIGRTVTAVRPMTAKEAEAAGWEFGRHGAPQVVALDDGSYIFASCDPEMNDTGHLMFGKNGKLFDA